MIEKSLARICICGNEVLELSCESEGFMSIWRQFVAKFGQPLTLKKISYKTRTFARNNRNKYLLIEFSTLLLEFLHLTNFFLN